MTPQTDGKTARKPPVGKPFQKGDDPRRNRAGRPKALLTSAIAGTLTDVDANKIISVVIAEAKAGNLQAIAMLWDRLEGKAIARNESGDPGAFTGLEDAEVADLLRLVDKESA